MEGKKILENIFGMIDEVLKTDSDHILTTAFEETFESDNFNYY